MLASYTAMAELPKSRFARAARVGRLAAGQGAKQLGTRAANVTRGDDAKRAALEKRQIETAEQIVAVLGTMKGAAMKLGQVMSFLDVGLVPEEYRDEFQAKLAELRDAAPKVAFKDMKKVLEGEYGDKLDEVFATFDPVPIAAASIGQVYRARLHDGRDVAVKVQYPGVAEAVRADMQNLGLILRLMKSVAPGIDASSMAREVRERIGEELDYELEASNQRAMARAFRNHPFIVVPDVVTSLSHEKVVVTEFVSGRGFEELKQLDQEERDRIGEIVFRFYFGSMYRLRMFSGDPHPGNMMLLDDGRMAFLDFGLFKHLDKETAERELRMGRLGVEGRGEELVAELREHGFLTRKEIPADVILEQFQDLTWWYSTDERVDLTPEIATQVVIEMSDPRSRHFEQMRHENLPAEHLFGRRLETLTLAVIGQLRAGANWHRIMREWAYGDEPATELGRAEAEYFATRA
jgi:predicted unusual protein kinase regulating ubiquinone biosynthesis (AarF/ABC1/UbiB family)